MRRAKRAASRKGVLRGTMGRHARPVILRWPMTEGRLVAIYTAERSGGPVTPRDSAEAVAGRGLRGDRYFAGDGAAPSCKPDEEVTLIEAEAVERLAATLGLPTDLGLP